MCQWVCLLDGLDYAVLEGGLYQMVLKPTLVVVSTDQCLGIWCMTQFGSM